jgi:hypothetical protein
MLKPSSALGITALAATLAATAAGTWATPGFTSWT